MGARVHVVAVQGAVDVFQRCDQLLASSLVSSLIDAIRSSIVFESNELGEQLVPPHDEALALRRPRIAARSAVRQPYPAKDDETGERQRSPPGHGAVMWQVRERKIDRLSSRDGASGRGDERFARGGHFLLR